MAILSGQLSPVQSWCGNPDKTVNIDLWGRTDPWWLDDLFYKDSSLIVAPNAGFGLGVNHQPTSVAHWGVSGYGIVPPLNAYDRPFFVMMRV